MSVDDDRQVSSGGALESMVHHMEQQEIGVDHRAIIGQAEGFLMVRLNIDADAAIDYLQRVSMESNRKLIDIAAQIVSTRELPDLGS